MRTLYQAIGTLLSLLIASAAASAACMPHPADPSAVQQNSFTVDLTFGGGYQVRCDVCTWAVSGGGTDLTLDATSLQCVSGGSGIDTVPATTIFSLLAHAAVAQSIANGYLTCSETCGEGVSTRLYLASCLSRSGSGSTTAFSICEQNIFCKRSYRVCCPSGLGSPSITFLSAEGPSCSVGMSCQRICQ